MAAAVSDQSVRSGRASLLSRLFAIVAVGAVSAGAGYLTGGQGGVSPPPAATPAARTDIVRGTVQSLEGATLTLSTEAGPTSVAVAPDAVLEALRPTTLGAVRPGDWLNAGAVPHQQTLLALSGIVIIPPSVLRTPR